MGKSSQKNTGVRDWDELTEKEREKLTRNFLEHLSAGYSKESFGEISKKNLQKLLSSVDENLLCQALARGRHTWESIGKRQAEGVCLGNSRSWILNMINRYGWAEKLQIEADVKGALKVEVVNYADTTVRQ